MTITIETVTRLYIQRRDEKEALEAEHKKRVAGINEDLARMEAALGKLLDDSGAKSAKTDYGTPYKQKWTSAKVKDREAFFAFVKEHDRFDLLTAACNKTQVVEEAEPVPGIELTTGYKINVKRPGK